MPDRKFDYILNIGAKIDKFKRTNPLEGRYLKWPISTEDYTYQLYQDSICIHFEDIKHIAIVLRPEYISTTDILNIDDSTFHCYESIKIYHRKKIAVICVDKYLLMYNQIQKIIERVSNMDIYSNLFINELLRITSKSYSDMIKEINPASEHIEVKLNLGKEPCVKQ